MHAYFTETFRDIRSLPRAVWVLTAGQFINRFGCFVYPFLALHLTQRGFAGGEVAFVLAAMAAGNLAAPFLSGYLSDGVGRRNTIVVSLVGGALTILALYYVHSLTQTALMACLHGLLANTFGPASHALMSDVVPDEKRVTAYAVFRLALNAGYAAGPAVAGLLYTRAPELVFWGDAATTLLFALLAIAFLPHGLRTIAGRISSPTLAWQSWVDAAKDIAGNRPALQLVAGKLFMSLSFIQIFHVLVLHATGRGLSEVEYGIVMGSNGAIIMFMELPLVQWIKRYAPKPVLAVGFALVGLGCASFAWAETMTGFLWAMGLFTLGEMIALPVSAALGARLAPEKFRGRYFGIYGMAWGFAGLAGSSGVWMFQKVGPVWWLVGGSFGLLAAACMMWRPRPPAAPVAEVAEPEVSGGTG
ncbi:MFS transporter [Actomonas aquatica]|uniref:MFS transporter n=1 Tax=Actomonas aquatica TaxID=2866162 RepID=A0ABZ1CCT2_9BACT|nr:MFS transporter [Opitutus sp. WL0086]WRQ88110.1 MFS transporter [Opitutus sp. WL0086]